jgi:hypothetical protein
MSPSVQVSKSTSVVAPTLLTPRYQVLLKIMKHSTDQLPPPPAATYQQDRNAPPPTNLSSHPDAVGVLLGLDLDGVMEVEDSFALPSGETSLGGEWVRI